VRARSRRRHGTGQPDRHPRVRPAAGGDGHREPRAGVGNRDADARALVPGADALRRRLRPVDRGSRRRLLAPRLVLLRQRDRGRTGRGHHERPPRWPDLVGPARLVGHRFGAGRRGLIPRAVPARDRRQAAADRGRMCPGRSRCLRARVRGPEGGRGPRGQPAPRNRLRHRFTWGRRRHLVAGARAAGGRADRPRPRPERRVRQVRRPSGKLAAAARPSRPRGAHPGRRRGVGGRDAWQRLWARVAGHRHGRRGRGRRRRST